MEEDFFADLEPLETLEELENLEELQDYGDLDVTVLEDPFIARLISTLDRSSLPFLLIDTSLRILWRNDAFPRMFGMESCDAGNHLFDPFDGVPGSSSGPSFTEAIKSPETGFSYRGRVQSSDPHRLTLQANMLVSPLFSEESGHKVHLGYSVCFDDVTEENKNILRGTFLSLLHASQMKDNDTGKHIKRVGEYSRLMAKSLMEDPAFPEVTPEFIDNITFLAPMHDVGKIGTPDDILNKEGPLEPWEWDVMREHTINGAYIMATYPHPMAKQIALSHHERWDGSGYPYNLSEEMIPLSARIVALADVYDALRMKRSYKEGFPHQKAMEIIQTSSESHFDPAMVNCFVKLSGTIREVYELLKDEPEKD
ncbi:MAG: HD domain-containing protein [Spirochaetales bacterium]|nr:HD domain-containing protein [Spirochaetales bacterium]